MNWDEEIKKKYYIRKAAGGWSPCIGGNPKSGIVPFAGSVLPNCVGWTCGRANSLMGYEECKLFGNRNAVNYVDYVKINNLEHGQLPKPGAVMVWGGGEGHVAIVEEVIDDNTVITSESGWSYRALPLVRSIKRKRGENNRWGYSRDFLMFIYLPDSPGPDPQPTYYTIKRGDTLSKIAQMYGVTVAELVEWNHIKNPNLIYPGDRILITAPAKEWYQVKRGDTLTKIARMYDTSLKKLLELNPDIRNPNLIMVGQLIRVR